MINTAVFTDLEYFYPGMERGQPRPTSANLRQIVQVSAIRYNMSPTTVESERELDFFDELVIPKYLDIPPDTLPSFFTELTAITNADVAARAIPFIRALKKFRAFCSEDPVYTFHLDEEVWRQNCGYHDVEFPFKNPFIRVKNLLPRWGINPNKYSSGTLHKAANIPMGEDHRVHDALSDVRSMAAAAFYFINTKGMPDDTNNYLQS